MGSRPQDAATPAALAGQEGPCRVPGDSDASTQGQGASQTAAPVLAPFTCPYCHQTRHLPVLPGRMMCSRGCNLRHMPADARRSLQRAQRAAMRAALVDDFARLTKLDAHRRGYLTGYQRGTRRWRRWLTYLLTLAQDAANR
jgi:hypothetical protein